MQAVKNKANSSVKSKNLFKKYFLTVSKIYTGLPENRDKEIDIFEYNLKLHQQ